VRSRLVSRKNRVPVANAPGPFTKFTDFFNASNTIQFNHLAASRDFSPPGVPLRVTYNVAWVVGRASLARPYAEGTGFRT
jgi:hypothetical protein